MGKTPSVLGLVCPEWKGVCALLFFALPPLLEATYSGQQGDKGGEVGYAAVAIRLPSSSRYERKNAAGKAAEGGIKRPGILFFHSLKNVVVVLIRLLEYSFIEKVFRLIHIIDRGIVIGYHLCSPSGIGICVCITLKISEFKCGTILAGTVINRHIPSICYCTGIIGH